MEIEPEKTATKMRHDMPELTQYSPCTFQVPAPADPSLITTFTVLPSFSCPSSPSKDFSTDGRNDQVVLQDDLVDRIVQSIEIGTSRDERVCER